MSQWVLEHQIEWTPYSVYSTLGPDSGYAIPHQRSRVHSYSIPHVERDQIGVHQLGVRFLRREGGGGRS